MVLLTILHFEAISKAHSSCITIHGSTHYIACLGPVDIKNKDKIKHVVSRDTTDKTDISWDFLSILNINAKQWSSNKVAGMANNHKLSLMLNKNMELSSDILITEGQNPNLKHYGIFITDPFSYINGDEKRIMNVDFEVIDLYSKHFDYDVLDFIDAPQIENQSENSDEYASSDEQEEIKYVDFHSASEESVVIKKLTTQDPFLNNLVSTIGYFRGYIDEQIENVMDDAIEDPLVSHIDPEHKVKNDDVYPKHDPTIPWNEMNQPVMRSKMWKRTEHKPPLPLIVRKMLGRPRKKRVKEKSESNSQVSRICRSLRFNNCQGYGITKLSRGGDSRGGRSGERCVRYPNILYEDDIRHEMEHEYMEQLMVEEEVKRKEQAAYQILDEEALKWQLKEQEWKRIMDCLNPKNFINDDESFEVEHLNRPVMRSKMWKRTEHKPPLPLIVRKMLGRPRKKKVKEKSEKEQAAYQILDEEALKWQLEEQEWKRIMDCLNPKNFINDDESFEVEHLNSVPSQDVASRMKNDIGYGASDFHRRSSSNKAAETCIHGRNDGIDIHALVLDTWEVIASLSEKNVSDESNRAKKSLAACDVARMWFCLPSLLSLKPPMGSVTRAYAYVGFYFCKLVIFFVLFKDTILTKTSNAKIDVLELDLIPLASARAFAANYLSLELPLHMLVYAVTATLVPFAKYVNLIDSYAYGRSKLANILHAEGINITANSLRPGFVVTDIFRGYNFFSVIVDKVVKYFVKDVAQGAATTCYIALNPKVKGVTNKYFSDSKTDYCNIKSWLGYATLPKDTIATPPVAETKAC
ncbi:short-chain dehydrogenase TIC 32, chloroplastic [Tanacetum coccineum]